ncbi:TolC family protein [Hippea jasoniae]|uniref:TolC family protein n=1 Tax=Hippea jasoniae TaxID=944479 RepID=UPI00054E6F8C|nr:TolC family protein [Hippea jasoniae]
MRWIIAFLIVIFTSTISFAGELSLNDVVNLSFKNNHLIKAYRYTIESAVLNKKAATSAMLPSLKFTYNYTHLKDKPFSYVMGMKMIMGDKDMAKWQIELIQPIFTGFALSTQREIAKLGINLSKIYLLQAKLDIAEKAKVAYFNILLAEKFVNISKERVKQLKAHLKDAENFYKEGLIPLNDLLKSKVAFAHAKIEYEKAKNNLKIAKSYLNMIMGKNINQNIKIKPIDSLKNYHFDLDQLFRIALNNNPSIKAFRLMIKQSKLKIKLIESDYYPHITAFAAYQQSGRDILASDNNFSNQHNTMVGVQINWDVFDSFKTTFEKEAQQHKVFELLEKFNNLKDQIKLNVKEAYLNLQTAKNNINVAKAALKQAIENYRVTNLRYKQQLTTSTEVLDAQTYLTKAKTDYYSALYGYYIAVAKLKRAIGSF